MNPSNTDDFYFNSLLELAVISSSVQMHRDSFSHELTRSPLGVTNINTQYWDRWDSGMELAAQLALFCRTVNYDAKTSNFWPLVDVAFQREFVRSYEFNRSISVAVSNFDSLCHGVINDNQIHMGSLRLVPGQLEETTDHYGLSVRWRVWHHYEGLDTTGTRLHTDNFSIARESFYKVNGRYPEPSDYGPNAKLLQGWSSSIYDRN